jgi:hypothetical protein
MMKILKTTLLAFLLMALAAPAARMAAEHGAETQVPFTVKQNLAPVKPEAPQRIHPPVTFLNEQGAPVARAGGALSLMQTCGRCHDTNYIAKNSYHATVGMNELGEPGSTASKRAWDMSPGLFGRWNPLTYRRLSARGDARLDLGTADWIRAMGPRHVGGGPAVFSRYSGKRLDEITSAGATDPETHVLDPDTGEAAPWDWKQSGTVEMNCLMCHVAEPDNAARVQAIREGKFRWASTATLEGSGMVSRNGDTWDWNPAAFNADGTVDMKSFRISDPSSDNCRACHGNACRCTDPVVFQNSLDNWSVETTGEIFSPDRMFDSGMNLKGKTGLSRPWDVHAERLMECANCHYAPNNPAYNEKESAADRPGHLRFDTRRTGFSDYLQRPDHNFAKGHTAQGTVARHMDSSMRDCRQCHIAENKHDFLPYKQLHFENISCQTCHVPQMHAPARRLTDWTVLRPDGKPMVEHKGVEGQTNTPESLIWGYRPVLLLHEETDGKLRLGPYNIIASWYWVEGKPPRPVRLFDLKKAFFENEAKRTYHPEILAALDANSDGTLDETELKLDNAVKVKAVAGRLRAVGVDNPRIKGELQPFTISHGIATGEFALSDCKECHSPNSRVNREVTLAGWAPGGVMPELVGDSQTLMQGEMTRAADGSLKFRPDLDPKVLYIHGTDRMRWMDLLGILSVVGVALGVGLHGALRVVAARRGKGGH